MQALDQAWEALKREFEAAQDRTALAVRSEITNELNQLLRRLRQYGTEGEWVSALLDSAGRFAQQAAVFEVKNSMLALRGQLKMDLPADLSFPLASAAAFASAVQTRDPVVALRSSSEVGEKLSAGNLGQRSHLIPLINGNRVAAVLFAVDGENTDANGLELVAGIASAVLERKSNVALHSQIGEAPKAKPSVRTLPAWANLGEEQRNLHTRAQRFARVTVAEMQLARPEACKAGREQSNLYLFLKNEIDRARDVYRKQFMTIPSMVDYLHLELIQTAAEGDKLKLGVEYPGQLV
ncbi:MAG: hypothetical protein JO150_04600 [Acidobacteriaceae bacterium]|nr:hypothetical protein [Acidobacteriaceae bacterium]MBV9937761.1 hypothetical protein [Acidobacteriaceae bacterium]